MPMCLRLTQKPPALRISLFYIPSEDRDRDVSDTVVACRVVNIAIHGDIGGIYIHSVAEEMQACTGRFVYPSIKGTIYWTHV